MSSFSVYGSRKKVSRKNEFEFTVTRVFSKDGGCCFCFSFLNKKVQLEIKCDTDEFQKIIKGGKRVKVIISYYQKTWLKRVKD